LIGSDGASLEDYLYDAYGNDINPPADPLSRLLYTGEPRDKETGFDYLDARYYAPTTGRFIRLDTFPGYNLDPQSLHKYIYCHNNPVNGTDPSGNIFISPAIKRLLAAFGVSKGLRVLIGIRVTYVLGAAYIRENPTSKKDDIDINRWIGRKNDTDLPPIGWIEKFMLRPDIIDHTKRQVHEIKRDNPINITAGMAEVASYIDTLNKRHPDRMYVPGTWRPKRVIYPVLGLPGIPELGFHIRTRHAGGGVVAYEVIPREESVFVAVVAAEAGMRALRAAYLVQAAWKLRVGDQLALSTISKF